jgi:CubicO group peptidase (beta-lactamase class C family)
MTGTDESRARIEAAIRSRVFPAAAADVGSSESSLWAQAFGTLTFDPDAPGATLQTPFDLASLTKVIATTSLVMDLVARGALAIEEPVAASFPEWRGNDREDVTVRDLLEHASGLPARLVDAPPAGRREFEHEICSIPLEYQPRTTSLYSDLDFILLGFLLADRGGPLAAQFDALVRALSVVSGFSRTLEANVPPLTFELDREARTRAAPTAPLADDPRRGRRLAGEVHDSYAAALSGAAGHAGLFGTAAAVGGFARVILRGLRRGAGRWDPALLARFATKSAVPGSSRALGWDTMLPTSSCGSLMSASAIGHTGFTGTSLWIDPERDRYFVLLTNRVCDGGTLEQMREVRRAFHDGLATF